jgi:hypothetical protein
MNVSLHRYVRRLWPLVLACPLSLVAGSDSIETVEKAAADWVKVRAETSRLETDWTTQQRMLESTVNGFAERATALEVKRDYLQAKTAKDREEMADFQAANKTASAGLQSTETQLKAMSARLLQLRPSLPPRLSQALELPYRSLAGAELGLGERMQLTMTVLNRCTQFNRSITCEEEVLTLGGDANARSLEVIYWGLSHGYALDRSAGKAWFGAPGAQGWQWEPLPDGAGPVAKLIAIYQSKAEPAFVEVPARIRNQAAEASKN